MTVEQIFPIVTRILTEALNIDEDEIKFDSTLNGDLGAESIDMLDITFRLERTFNIKVARNELFPDHIFEDRQTYIQDGKITKEGIAKLRASLPYSNFEYIEKDPYPENIMSLFTVGTICRYVQHKLGTQSKKLAML